LGMEREEIEKVEKRYLNWVLEVEARTPKYLIKGGVTERDKLRRRAKIEHGGLKKNWRRKREAS